MTKPELTRRLATIPHATAVKAYEAILQGCGRLDLEYDVTVKQANALHAWHNRYGRIYPMPSDCK